MRHQTMNRGVKTAFMILLFFPAVVSGQSYTPETLRSLAGKFKQPTGEYRPHVWWHWLGSNFSKEGITKDLEAMKETGIGGATIFNISSSVQESHYPMENNPWPEQTFRSEAWWEALKHTMKEAKRLGLKIGLHGTPGYATTGGPWITEERGMKALVSSKTVVEGGKVVDIVLPRPELPEFTGYDSRYVENYKPWKAVKYWDVTVVAVPDAADISADDIVEIPDCMDADGRLTWQAPAGKWIVYRYGYAPTMAHPHPLPDDLIGKAWEVDKMSREDNTYHWQQLLEPLKEQIGEHFGETFTYIWVDSYESGYQNWTPGFRKEFIRIKGYDPIPWIAMYQYRNNKEMECRFSAWYSPKLESDLPDFQVFLKDYDDVVNRLFMDNGFAVGREMLHKYGLKLYWEPYEGPFSNYEGAMIADIPVGEFWSSDKIVYESRDALKVAVEFNKRIVAAEALTGTPLFSRYNEDPAFLKHTVDGGYASGYNLYFLHHWVHQPFDDKYQPGMGMGWWGTHFSRFQTWIKPAQAFFTYMSRCQLLLQQGDYVPGTPHSTHRRTPEADIFFVINMDREVRNTYAFPVKDRVPELWDAYRGVIRKTSKWRRQGDSVYVDLNLGKDESMFVVFPAKNGKYDVLPEIDVLKRTTVPVNGSWKVTFRPKLDKPFNRTFPSLVDWSKQKEDVLKYFSGTAKYEKEIHIAAGDLKEGKRIMLDLGELHDIAELEINGKDAGVLWFPPYTGDITPYLRAGMNKIAVYITNNWANRLIGDEQYPADFEWGQDRREEGHAMKAFPDWFLKNVPRPSKGRKTFNIWYYYRKDSPLYPAGLLGPVRLIKEDMK
ncbi:MAG: hypothetical protein LBF17_03920 [Mediterranea sp.]|nr:hypothetical protein [Mediterranea sp.]